MKRIDGTVATLDGVEVQPYGVFADAARSVIVLRVMRVEQSAGHRTIRYVDPDVVRLTDDQLRTYPLARSRTETIAFDKADSAVLLLEFPPLVPDAKTLAVVVRGGPPLELPRDQAWAGGGMWGRETAVDVGCGSVIIEPVMVAPSATVVRLRFALNTEARIASQASEVVSVATGSGQTLGLLEGAWGPDSGIFLFEPTHEISLSVTVMGCVVRFDLGR